MDRTRASRGWRTASAVAAVVAVAALVALGFWVVGQPGTSAGTPLADVRAAAPSPPPSLTPTASVTPTPSPSRTPSPSARVSKPPTSKPPRTKPPTTKPPTSKPRTLPRPTARDASPDGRDSSAASPVRLVIRDLGVDAAVDDVGVRKDGAMVIPTGSRVGWYRYGSAPDDPHGNTVIAGHVATGENGAGAMAPLRKAQPGMRVIVTTADGADHVYEVRGRETIVKKRLPVDEIFARDGRPLLVLITCGGEYIPELRSHRDNIVVTAAPVG